jgi:hypothetical protein
MKINKQAILEEVQNIRENAPMYIYHIGAKGYSDIKSGGMIRTKKEKKEFMKKHELSEEYMKIYDFEVSAFMAPVTKEMVNIMVSAGSNVWKNSGLYLYKININDPINKKNIKYCKFTSLPASRKYNKIYFTKKFNQKEFEDFRNKRDMFLNQKYGIKNKMSVQDIQNLNKNVMKDFKNLSKYFKINAKYGSKTQYASYIPHIQLIIKAPLKFESVSKIN